MEYSEENVPEIDYWRGPASVINSRTLNCMLGTVDLSLIPIKEWVNLRYTARMEAVGEILKGVCEDYRPDPTFGYLWGTLTLKELERVSTKFNLNPRKILQVYGGLRLKRSN